MLPLSEFRAFGALLRLALTRDPDDSLMRAIATQFDALEGTGYESDDPVTEPRVFSQGAGMERVIDVPVNDIEST